MRIRRNGSYHGSDLKELSCFSGDGGGAGVFGDEPRFGRMAPAGCAFDELLGLESGICFSVSRNMAACPAPANRLLGDSVFAIIGPRPTSRRDENPRPSGRQRTICIHNRANAPLLDI